MNVGQRLTGVLVALVMATGVAAARQAVAPPQHPTAPSVASPAPPAAPSALTPAPATAPSAATPAGATPPSPGSTAPPSPGSVAPSPTAAPVPTPTPTLPPIVVQPVSAQVAVGATERISVQSTLGAITAVAANPQVVGVAVGTSEQSIYLTGRQPGTTSVTVTDGRGLQATVPVQVAFLAGSVPPAVRVALTGDPASADFVRLQVARAIRRAVTLQPGAQLVLDDDAIPFEGTLDQDRVATLNVPVLLQGTAYFEVDATVAVTVENVAVPRISPASLMVSDFPEKLTVNGVLFASDLTSEQPSRFLYFHYNPPGQPNRRIVLRAENRSPEPALVQFISGRGGPTPNEMEAGHTATKTFLVDVVQNQGSLVTIPAHGSLNLVEQDLPTDAIVCNLLQLRLLSGSGIHLTLFAQNASDDPNTPPHSDGLLAGTHRHARGIYPIPEFHYASSWNVTDRYLELPIGQIPLPNRLRGHALSGDYGVLESFVVTIENPLSSPQAVAIYENPRGGYATGTYLIDGVLVQSHQVPPFSRYKVRQYVVPAHGFVRVTIVTMPEAGSSYPLKLIFAPDDGSVPPGGSGSPVY